MFGSNLIRQQLQKSTRRIQVSRPRLHLRNGALVRLADNRVGFVQFIRTSPYYVEEKQGIKRAYIYSAEWDVIGGKRWTDYVLLDVLEVIG